MLESFAATFLNRFLGSYVENFDANQLEVGIWNGDVKLKNCKIKNDCLDALDLPISIKQGVLGNLTMQVPWSRLKSSPVKIEINDIYLLVEPKSWENYDPKETLEREFKKKMAKLAQLELLSNTSTSSSLTDDSATSNESFTTSLINKVVDNVQVSIENIHIRYEDYECLFSREECAMGICFQQLSAKTCNDDWEESFVEVVKEISKKIVTLDNLGVYIRTGNIVGESFLDEDIDVFISRFKESVVEPNVLEQLIHPISGTCKLSINKKGSTAENPRFNASLDFDSIGFEIFDSQYQTVLDIMANAKRFEKSWIFKEIRPLTTVMQSPDEWLKYVLQCVLTEIHEKNKQYTWENMKRVCNLRREYTSCWKQKLLTRRDGTLLDKDLSEKLLDLHKELPLDEIMLFRSIAKKVLLKERKEETLKEQKDIENNKLLVSSSSNNSSSSNEPELDSTTDEAVNNNQKGWFSSWWGGGEEASKSSAASLEFTEEQKKEFYDAIEYDEHDHDSTGSCLPKDRITLNVVNKLKTGFFKLKNRNSGLTIAELLFSDATTRMFQRPDSFGFQFELNTFSIEDKNQNSTYRNIVKVNTILNDPESNAEDFFKVYFEKKPVGNDNADSLLNIKLNTMSIYYNPQFITSITNFFKTSDELHDTLAAVIASAGTTVEGWTQQTRIGLESIIEEHKNIDLNLDLKAPLIILPIYANRWDSACVLIDAGNIKVTSDLIQKSNIEKIKQMSLKEYQNLELNDSEKIERFMYDRFNMELNNLQLLVGPDIKTTVDSLRQSNNGVENSWSVIGRSSLSILFDVSIFQKALNYPKFKMNLVLPLLKLNLSDYQYRILIQVAAIFGFQPVQDDDVNNDVIDLTTNKSLQQFLENTKDFYSKLTENQLKQKLFEMNVRVDQISLNLKKKLDKKLDNFISICSFTGSQMKLSLSKFYEHMDVDFLLNKILLTENTTGESKILISCTENADESTDLFKLGYMREQRIVHYDGFLIDVYDQTANLDMSSLLITLNSKSILTIMTYLRNTFTDVSNAPLPTDMLKHNDDKNIEESPQKMKVNLNLEKVSLIFEEMQNEKLASLSFSDSSLSIYLLPEKLKIHGKLKHLELFDLIYENYNSEIRQLIYMDDENEFSEFKYETFDCEKSDKDVTSNLEFKASSLKIKFMEQTFGRLFEYFNNLQEMKSIFDKTRSITFDNSPDLDTIKKIKLDILVKTPIIEFPSILNPVDNICDNMIFYLGEFNLVNEFNSLNMTSYKSSLTNMKVTSLLNFLDKKQFLHMIENLDISLNMDVQNGVENKAKSIDIFGQLSNSELNLTNLQIDYLRNIMNTVVSTFNPPASSITEKSGSENDLDSIWNVAMKANAVITPNAVYKAEADELDKTPPVAIEKSTSISTAPSLNLKFSIPIMSLTLYDNTDNKEFVDECSLTKVSLNGSKLELSKDDTNLEKMKLNYTLGSFSVKDLRNYKENVHSDLIPFCSKSENQLTVNYSETMIDGNEIIKKSHIILDNLRVILAVDYLIAMKVFWNKIVLSPVGNSHSALLNKSLVSQPSLKTSKNKEAPKDSTIKSKSQITFEALNPNIVLLANLELEDSEAFVFKVEHLLFDNLVQEQNEVISLNMLNIGMFMCNMNTFEKSHIRLVDDFSTSFYQNKTGQVSNLKLDIEDMIIRVALRDIRLGNKIFKKSLHLATTNGLFGDSLAMRMNANGQKGIKFSREFKLALAKYAPSVLSSFTFMEKDEENISTLSSNIQPSVIVTDENFNVNFGGARLVIIGDVSELPMIDFHTEKLQIGIKDWSTDLNFITNLTLYTNVFNYSKSDWEPLIEPFTFTIEGFRGRKAGVENSSDAAMNINISSNDSSDITISSQSLKLLSKIPQSLSVDSVEELVKLSRDETKPFKIKNDTGISIQVWVYNYHDKNQRTNLTTIADGESIPWEFEDWIKLRENLDTDNTNSTIVFKPIGDEYASTFKINTKTETETLFRLEPPINNVHSRIECKIKLGDDGIKLIHFASPLKFTNYTSADLELFYNEYDSIVIEKKTTKSIPIDKVYYSEYEIKPITTNDDYIKSVQKIKWKDILNSSIMKSKCLNSKTGEYFYFDVTCQYNSKEKLTAVFPHMEIIVSAPFMIENALPMEAHFNIVSKETGENINFNLKSGSLLPIHNINFSDDLVFLKTFPFDSGYTPKDYTLIAAPKKLNLPVEDSTVLTRRENKVVNTLKLSISYNSDPITNCHIVKVFVPFIILNKTSRCIYINEKKKNNIFACPVNTNEQDETYSGIQMISFENTVKTNEKDTNKNALAQIKMFDTDWSLPISLDAIGKDLDLILPIPNKTNGNEIGVNIKEGFGIFADTKIITITPRFIITNYTNQNLVFNETMSLAEFLLENKQPIPIYKMSMNADKYCRLKVYSEGEQAEYCEPFELNIKSDLDYVKLRDPKTGKHILIKIEKLMDKSTLFINLKNSQDSWPFSIRNFTETTFTIYQRDPRVKNSFIKKKQGENEVVEYDQTLAKMSSDIGYYKTMKIFDTKRYNLSEYSIMPFSWDFPSAKDKKLMIQCGNVVRTIDLQMIGSLRPLVISSMVNGAEERTFIELNILADGPTLALVLTKYNPDVSIYKINTYEKKPTHSIYNDSNDVDSFNTSSNELSSTNSQSLFKVPDSQKIDVATLRVLFNVSGVGISIVNKRLKEISYSKIKGIEVRYNNSKIYNSVSWKIKWLQIDNQLFEDNYKNVLYPTIVTDRRDDMEQHPVFSGSVTKVNDETTGMTYIKHATLLLQEMSLNLDEEFVIEVMDFLNLITIPNTFNKNNSANKFSGSHNDNIMTPYLEIVKENAESNEEADGIALGETDYYHLTLPLCSKKLERKNLHFENLHIQPTVMHFSFMRSESIQLQDNCMDLITLTQRKKASSFLNAIYMTLGNISDAPVKLNSLIMENYKTSANTLKEDVISHYNTEIYNQLLKLVGYADVLGNPIGLLNNLSNGVADIFYNPYQDGYYMNDRPEELGISFSKGGMSFLKKSVFGFSDSFAKFTGSVAKGLTAATNDKNFQRERYLQQRKNKFSNDANSFSSGFNSLVQGVSSGFNGIATNPLEGAKKDGTAGFFRGLGKGLVGMPTKTMIGFLDMANNVSDGIKTSTGAYDPNDPYNSKNGHYETIVRSLRYPRYISNGLCFSLDPMDGLIKPYDKRQAYGQYLLKTCNSGEFLYDNYVDHEYLPGNQRVVIVSEENLLEVNIENMKVTFRLKIEEICKMGAPVDDGRQIIVRGRDPNTNMICQGRFPIIDLKAKQRILTKILLAQSKVIKYMDTEL